MNAIHNKNVKQVLIKKNELSNISSIFHEKINMASCYSMSSLEKIGSTVFRKKMSSSEYVPEIHVRDNDLPDQAPVAGDSNDLTQCYSVTTGRVSTVARAPSFSSLSSIEVAEINTPSYCFPQSNSSIVTTKGYSESLPYHLNTDTFVVNELKGHNYIQNLSSKNAYNAKLNGTETYCDTQVFSPIIMKSRVVQTRHHGLCVHGSRR